MQAADLLKNISAEAIHAVYGLSLAPAELTINETKPEFEGDYTLVTFALVKQLRMKPDELANALGDWLVANHGDTLKSYNVIKGFLNLSLTDAYWLKLLTRSEDSTYGFQPTHGGKVMVEYSSPNTNKPLHLGHLRNNFLGLSVARLFEAMGHEVMKTCIVNDRGVHICKSMLAWKRFGGGATPASTHTKGDHFVGDYYVQFEHALKTAAEPILQQLLQGDTSALSDSATKEKATLLAGKLPMAPADKQAELTAELKEMARNATDLMQEVRRMLLLWEQGDPETLEVWRQMNGWVYEGFAETYQRIGSSFDKTYYESDTYLLGKRYVESGLASGVFFQKEDGSVWINLEQEGLDEKLVLRKDGTSVYITQDLGLAQLKYDDFPMEASIYVVGDEQNYHMQVLSSICRHLGMPFAEGIRHLSYGMVELPSGRMKSREGTVVDADDLCDEMERVAAEKTEELGKTEGFTPDELKTLYHMLGMGALKFYLLRVDAKKKMLFNPEESIDFHGFTGPFVQYTHARIKSVLRKAAENGHQLTPWQGQSDLLPLERKLLIQLEQFPEVIQAACSEMNPSLVALYVFNLAKTYNGFYAEHSVAFAESDEKRHLRLHLCRLTAQCIQNGCYLLGIAVPERM